jgi:hypothetical protein
MRPGERTWPTAPRCLWRWLASDRTCWPECLITPLLIQTIRRVPSWAVWIDEHQRQQAATSVWSRPAQRGVPGYGPEDRARLVSVCVSVHQPAPDRTLAVWLDSSPDLSCTNSTRGYWVDAEHQPTDLAVGGSNPSRRATNIPAQRPCSRVAEHSETAGLRPNCDPVGGHSRHRCDPLRPPWPLPDSASPRGSTRRQQRSATAAACGRPVGVQPRPRCAARGGRRRLELRRWGAASAAALASRWAWRRLSSPGMWFGTGCPSATLLAGLIWARGAMLTLRARGAYPSSAGWRITAGHAPSGSGAARPSGALRAIDSCGASALLADLRSAPPAAVITACPGYHPGDVVGSRLVRV